MKNTLLSLTILLSVLVNAQNWTQVGSAAFTPNRANHISMTIAPDGTNYVAYADQSSSKVNVMKYDGSAWVQVGTANFSNNNTADIRIAVGPDNLPVVANREVINSFTTRVAVRKFDGTSWVNLSTSGIPSGDPQGNLAIAVGKDSTIYIAHELDGGLTVDQFNGSSWVNVGSANFSAGGVSEVSMVISPHDTLYVLYVDNANGDLATVQKYDGSTWNLVGPAGFSSPIFNTPRLAIASDETPYIAYTDRNGFSLKASVMKFSSGSWNYLGGPEFTNGRVLDIASAISPQDTLYIVFTSDAQGSKLTSLKWDGTSWDTVGTPGFTPGRAYQSNLILNPDRKFYVAYQDDANSDKASVMSFKPCEIVSNVDTIGVCSGDSILVGTNYYSAPGTYLDTISSACGVDSMISITLFDAPTYDFAGTKSLFFSQYMEGSSWNKAIEIYNPTNSSIDLSEYRIQRYGNGSSSASNFITLSGMLAPGNVYVVCHSSANSTIKAAADQQSSSLSHNGDDAIGLFHLPTSTLVDVFGNIGQDPGSEWSVPGTNGTADESLIRKSTVTSGTTDFNVWRTQWTGDGNDNASDLGQHTSIQTNAPITYDTLGLCSGDSILLGGLYRKTAGSYYDTLYTQWGCDSIVQKEVSILPTFIDTVSLSICMGDSTLLGGAYQSTAGTYFDTLSTILGCDSVIRTELSILPTYSDTLNVSICSGDSILLAGAYRFTAGIYPDTLIATNGCDSIINHDLSITPVIYAKKDLFFSQYYDALSNAAIEIYNPTDSTIDLSEITISLANNGSATSNSSSVLSGNLAPKSYYIATTTNANATIQAKADTAFAPPSAVHFTGNDFISLLRNGDTLDIIGELGIDPGSNGWSVSGTNGVNGSTNNHLLIKDSAIYSGTTNWNLSSSSQWYVYPNTNPHDLGVHGTYPCALPCSTTFVNDTIGLCEGDSILIAGSYISSTGDYNDTLIASTGCDSIVTYHLDFSPAIRLMQTPSLFFSQYHEGPGGNVAIEIYNPTNEIIDMSEVTLSLYTNGGTTNPYSAVLKGSLAPKDHYIASYINAETTLKANADTLFTAFPAPVFFTGDDAVVLFRNGDTLDIIGIVGVDPGSEYPVAGTNGVNGSTNNHLLIRDSSVFSGTTDWALSSTMQWGVYPNSDPDALGIHATLPCSFCPDTLVQDTTILCQGDSLLINGNYITAAGNYSDSLKNICGGDSIIELVVNVVPTITLTSPPTLFFSEYVEGSSGDKGLEIYNPTQDTVDLSEVAIEFYTGGSPSPSANSLPALTGLLYPNSTFTVVRDNATDPNLLANADTLGSTVSYTGDDAVVLLRSGDTLDIVGIVGNDPGSSWTVNGTNGVNGVTRDQTLVRESSVFSGTTDWALSSSSQWKVYPNGTTQFFGSHDPYPCVAECLPGYKYDTLMICEGDSALVGNTYYNVAGTYADTLAPITACGADSINLVTIEVNPSYVIDGKGLIISEYIEGSSGWNKAVEIFNGSLIPVDLSNYRIQRYSNGSSSASSFINLSGTLASRSTFVVCHPSADPPMKAIADLQSSNMVHNGDDAVALYNTSTNEIVDLIGVIGQDPGSAWGIPSGGSTANASLVRNSSVIEGSTDWNLVRTQFTAKSSTDLSDLGTHTATDEIMTTEICQGDSILIEGIYRKTSGIFADTFQTALGCDSIYITKLVVNESYDSLFKDTICQGDSIMIAGLYRHNAGIYTDSLTSVKGCDSLISVDLFVLPAYKDTTATSICMGDSVLFAGSYYSSAGFYSTDLLSAAGCDSTVYLDLSVLPTYADTSNQTICRGDSVIFGGVSYFTAGYHFDTLTAGNGCDSIQVLDLTVLPTPTRNLSVSICAGDSIPFAGSFRKKAGTYYDTLIAANGCDSIIGFTVNLKPVSNDTSFLSICEGDSVPFDGGFRKVTGFYKSTFTSSNGCDSIVNLDLTVNPVPRDTSLQTICSGDSIMVFGNFESKAGLYVDSAITVLGCDSLTYVDLKVNPVFNSSVSANICQGDSILLGGQYQKTSGFYYDTLMSSNGCDSIITTTLFVDPTLTSNLTASICQGDSILIGGQYRLVSGVYDDTLSSLVSGCDSIVSTNLTVDAIPTKPTINSSGDSIFTSTTFMNYEWFLDSVSIPNSDQPYWIATVTGTYHVEVENAQNCNNTSDTLFHLITGLPLITEERTGVTMFPNPSNGEFTIELGSVRSNLMRVRDITGKVVNRISIEEGVNRINVNLKHLSKGVYFVEIQSKGNEVMVEKIVIH